MSAAVSTTGAEGPRLPSAHLEEPPRAVALLLASWVILLQGALIVIFVPVLVFTTKDVIPPSDIATVGLVGVICLTGGGLVYVPRRWTWWTGARLDRRVCRLPTGGRGARFGPGGLRRRGAERDRRHPAPARVDPRRAIARPWPWRARGSRSGSKVTAVWIAIFLMLGLFLALSRARFRLHPRERLVHHQGPRVDDRALGLRDRAGDRPGARSGPSGGSPATRSPTASPGFYMSFFRGTPLIVQMFLIYLALPEVGANLGRRSLVDFLTLDRCFVAGVHRPRASTTAPT